MANDKLANRCRIQDAHSEWFFPMTREQLTMLEEGNVADPEIMQALTGREAISFSVEHLDYLGNQEAVGREAD